MAIVDGNPISAAYTNSRLASKQVDNTLEGVQTLDNSSDPNSGATITNIQQRMNELASEIGRDGDGAGTNDDYSSNNVVTNGQDRRAAIGALDTKFANISIDELTDVDITGITDTQILIWNNGAGEFQPGNQAGGGATDLDGLTDVTITARAANQKLKVNAGNTLWENVTDDLDSLDDVDLTGANNGDVLTLVAGTWNPVAPSGGSFPGTISSQTGTFAAADDNLYIIDVSGGAAQVNLPAPSSGLKFSIKIMGDAATNNVTINRNAAEEIEGVAANLVLTNELGAYKFISDGTDWFII